MNNNPMTHPQDVEPAALKPCPLCGGVEIYVAPDETGSGGQWVPPVHVGCKPCGLDLVDLEGDGSRSDAIVAWNTRASPSVTVEVGDWALVPREPTQEMMLGGAAEWGRGVDEARAEREKLGLGARYTSFPLGWIDRIYRAMIASSPSPSGDLREAVARIVDPTACELRDELRRTDDLPAAYRPPKSMLDKAEEHCAKQLALAYTKADQIAALYADRVGRLERALRDALPYLEHMERMVDPTPKSVLRLVIAEVRSALSPPMSASPSTGQGEG